MTVPSLIRRERELLQELTRLAAERARAQVETETAFASRNEQVEKEYQETRQQTQTWFEAEKTTAETEHDEALRSIATQFETERTATEKEYAEVRGGILSRFVTDKERADKQYQEACWTITTLFDAKKTKARERFQDVQKKLADVIQKLQAVQQEAKKQLDEWRHRRVYARVPVSTTAPIEGADPLGRLDGLIADGEAQLADLKELILPRFFKGLRLTWLFVIVWVSTVLWILVLSPTGWVAGQFHWSIAGTVIGLAIGLLLAMLLYAISRAQVSMTYRPLRQTLYDAKALCKQCQTVATEEYQRRAARLAQKEKERDEDLRQTEEKYQRLIQELEHRRDRDLKQADARYPPRLQTIQQRHDHDLREAEEKYQRRRSEAQARYDRAMHEIEEKHTRLLAESQAAHERDWTDLSHRWTQGLANVRADTDSIQRQTRQLYPDWSDSAWNDWQAVGAVPSVIRFGDFQVSLDQVPDAVPEDERLKPAFTQFELPALLPFPHQCSMLFKSGEAGRPYAVQALQALMLRFLTGLPAGKVRFTIIDPVGLGENFAAFMHLADYNEALVTNRIWTESQHIEQRLTDLTAHMENVIQKYLRKQFQTIEEYNAQAGEVAEPYRILVVANFPVGFTPDAARRLVSIASSGAACGVYTLVSVDTKQPVPQGFNLKDLEQTCVNLVWKESRFLWKEPDFGKYPLRFDPPPEAEFCTRLMHQAGAQARDANRVEVRFDFVAPTPEQIWTGDSRHGIEVALGRAGALKRQYLRLGKGTAQHVLVAGKTGSGKSTLLHALITNLALLYSPDEIELYLIDFKKGVEFKTYAAFELPHARVVAIESEREFGLSVLQRLDAELKARGERFRDAGAPNVGAFREARPDVSCPRIVLIVDEFQEFFVEDDKIAQEAALLLDRLVRQGRAFGMHILLGSQTLGGAYSLARSTIDQMAVRIALQCSETDAHLILSKDNAAARLLSRPGEAIYNDANGMLEGNDLFQIVWLPDERREQYLQEIQERQRHRANGPVLPLIVFEGNAPADLRKNHLLEALLAAPNWPVDRRAFHAWLGDAIAIKDPTAAVFRPQSGSNLLVIGQADEAVLGMFTAALVSLAAQHRPAVEGDGAAAARFLVLDGSPVDAPHAGYLAQVGAALPSFFSCSASSSGQTGSRVGGWRELPGMIGELASEVERRQKTPDAQGPTLYLLVYGLHRFRDLRKADDDFGYSRRGEEKAASPAKQFGTILRDGPAVGMHVLVWCDSLNNANRALDRQALREFEMRVLFQMSVADSSTLIDSPVASKLGMHRALFFTEDQGRAEKFRPYGLPPASWLACVASRLERPMVRGQQSVARGP